MRMRLEGIHHISAITGDAAANVDFYARVLGLRLVAKTVNQDDPSVYHLFYGSEHGRPGSEITFFEYPSAVRGRAGDGMVHTIVWRVGSAAALDFWAARLAADGVATERLDPDRLRFSDPEGLAHELAVVPHDLPDEPLRAVHPDVPAEHALQGFAGVRAYTTDVERSRPTLERLLGAREVPDDSGRHATTFGLRGERRGGTIAYDPPPATDPRGRPGAGTVHHVAWGTTVDEHPVWFARLRDAGLHSSPVVDRHYFKAIYFREPSGVLFEISDDEPGFTVDVPLEDLGSVIILPPHLEPERAAIEARLTPLPDPRAVWAA